MMKKLLYCIVLILACGSLAAQNTEYFPKGALDKDVSGDNFVREWYGVELTELHESPLPPLAKEKTNLVYRFTWLRTFHNAVAIRLQVNPDGSGTLYIKKTSGASGFFQKKHELIVDESRPLTAESVTRALETIQKADFWKMGYPTPQGGADGAEWVFEGVKDGSYHVAHRWSPENGSMRELGMFFLFDLAKLKVPKNEIY
jgi:hypothetical protein